MNNKFLSNLHFPCTQKSEDIYEKMRKQDLPIYIYGAGNLATKIIQNLEIRKISIAGVLIDKEVGVLPFGIREKVYPIFYFSEFISECREKCNLIIGFAKGYRRKSLIENMSIFHEVYIIDSPFEHQNELTGDFTKKHMDKLSEAYGLFSDELSRQYFCAYINSRINKEAMWVIDSVEKDINEFNNDVITLMEDEVFLDVGAYDGGSIKRFLTANKLRVKKIIGIEPDEKNFNNLELYMKAECKYDYKLYRIGCWKEKSKLPFNNDGKCSRLSQESHFYIDVDKVDSICGLDEEITLFNMGISVAEYEILQGSSELIKKWHPKMIIFMGAAKSELWEIPMYIKKLSEDYRIYLRFLTAMPSRFFLYAV